MWTCKHGDAPKNDGGKGETITGKYNNTSVSTGLGTAAEVANYIAGGNYYDFWNYRFRRLPSRGVFVPHDAVRKLQRILLRYVWKSA